MFIIAGCSQETNGAFYPASIHEKEVASIEIFDADTNEFLIEYFEAPEKQILSKAIESAEPFDSIGKSFEFKIEVKYADKSAEYYLFNISEHRFKKGDQHYNIDTDYQKAIQKILSRLESED